MNPDPQNNNDSKVSVCKQWVQDIKKIVVFNFEDVQKGWYSIRETSAESYAYGKIKKLLTVGKASANDAEELLAAAANAPDDDDWEEDIEMAV